MIEFTVTVQARIGPGIDQDTALALVAEDTHVEQDGSTGAVIVRRHVERLEADNAYHAARRVQRELADHIAGLNVDEPVPDPMMTWQVHCEPYVEQPWWQAPWIPGAWCSP